MRISFILIDGLLFGISLERFCALEQPIFRAIWGSAMFLLFFSGMVNVLKSTK